MSAVAHRDLTYPGQHQAIVDEGLWQEAQTMLADDRNGIGVARAAESRAFLSA